MPGTGGTKVNPSSRKPERVEGRQPPLTGGSKIGSGGKAALPGDFRNPVLFEG